MDRCSRSCGVQMSIVTVRIKHVKGDTTASLHTNVHTDSPVLNGERIAISVTRDNQRGGFHVQIPADVFPQFVHLCQQMHANMKAPDDQPR